MSKHWTANSVDAFLFKIAADFIMQLDKCVPDGKRTELAHRLGVTPSRVSQVFNNPGNLTLKTCVQYAQALGRKVVLVAYDDGDSNNTQGLVNSEVFEKCWEQAGRPRDMFDCAEVGADTMTPEKRGTR